MILFFNDTATTEIYTLSLHDALPISEHGDAGAGEALRQHLQGDGLAGAGRAGDEAVPVGAFEQQDRKSTRLNSSHANISYAVFCLKKKDLDLSSSLFHAYLNLPYSLL